MGSKGSKTSGKDSKLPHKPVKFNEKDYKFLTAQTGMSMDDIKKVFQNFHNDNPDGILNKQEFEKLYQALRTEPVSNLDEIDDLVFRAFDKDNNGFLTFSEFMVAYALTSKGDPKAKLEYAFELYDADNNGWLNRNEVKEVITAMLDLLGADKRVENPSILADEVLDALDKNDDNKVTKDEFINGLLNNYSIRVVMSPFN